MSKSLTNTANHTRTLLAVAIALSLSGCVETGSESDSNAEGDPEVATSTTRVAFDPASQILPFPNNLLFEAGIDNTDELDGTINAPVPDDPDSAGLVQALNSLDGFSTVEAWRVEFTGEIDESSLKDHVRFFELSPGDDSDGYPRRLMASGVERELTYGEDFELSYTQGQDEDGNRTHVLKIQPSQRLDYNTTYAAVLQRGLKDAAGEEVGANLPAALARDTGMHDYCYPERDGNVVSVANHSLSADDDDAPDPDRVLLQCMTDLALGPVVQDTELERNDALVAWSVTTQRKDIAFWHTAEHMKQVLDGVKAAYDSGAFGEDREVQMAHFLDIGSTGEEAPQTPDDKATIWPGAVRLPVALQAPGDVDEEGNAVTETPQALTDYWSCMPQPTINLPDELIDRSDEAINCNTDEAREAGYVANYPVPTSTEFEKQEFRALESVPVTLTVPNEEETDHEAPYPVVIYQHAIRQNRTNALAVADELAEQGYAVVAIDMPLHGMNLAEFKALPDDDPQKDLKALHAVNFNEIRKELEDADESWITSVDNLFSSVHERTYYLDLEDEDGVAGSDGLVDTSGSHFLIPDEPLSQRDVMRQGALDLTTLSHYMRQGFFTETCVEGGFGWGVIDGIAGTGCDNDINELLNTDEIHFMGHSVGSVVAAPFLTFDEQIASVTMLAPTGGIMRSLENSEQIGPQLSDGLAESGLEKGQEDYYRFFSIVQAALDSVDPLNHAGAIGQGTGDNDRPVYMAQILGNDGSDGNAVNDPDLVLPPEVQGHPLAGSTALANAMGLSHQPTQDELDGAGTIDLTPEDGATLQTRIGFRYGDHGSFLQTLDEVDDRGGTVAGLGESDSEYEAHNEMQQQLGSFLGSDGNSITIKEPELIKGTETEE